MTEKHPITPPPELIKEWMSEFNGSLTWPGELALHTANRAAEWGADQELEACCQLLDGLGEDGERLRLHRRCKPPSLKQQALEEVGVFEGMGTCNIDIIRRALEAIPDE